MLASLRSAMFVKVMMVIVAAAFVGLIVLEWGADYSSTSRSASNLVGVINGHEISYEMFDQQLRNAHRVEKGRGVEDPDIGRLVQQEWDRLITQTIVAEQIENFQIQVSDQEIDFFNRNSPPPEIQNIESFQTEGKFDITKYHFFLDTPSTYTDPNSKNVVLYAENRAREQLLSGKLQDHVAGSINVTDAEVRNAFEAKKAQVQVVYAGIEAAQIPDSLVTVEDKALLEYYNAHQGDFKQEEAIRASFVTFTKTPSVQDEENVGLEIQRIRVEVEKGGDFAELAKEYSEDPGSARNGGDLGFFSRGQMVGAFEDTAFSLNSGTLSQPFKTQFGWHILKVEDRKGEGDSLQVKARHILLKIEPGRDTLDELRVTADDFVEQARSSGLKGAATSAGLQTSDTGYITAGAFFPLLGNKTSGLVNNFLEEEPGAISPTFESERGIYIFALTDKRDAGTRPLDEVKNQVAARVRQNMKRGIAEQRVQVLLAEVRAGTSLESSARKLNLRYTEPEPFAKADFVPTVGSRNGFVGKAFELEAGQTSDVISTRNGAYVLKVIKRIPAEESLFDLEKAELTNQLVGSKKNDLISAWFTNLRARADIVDNRHRFFTEF
ncbi:MAG: peptidylprolyl isomerase [Candidatus Latescibacterota bacterium]|nr:peptidylprolyl isomerase [Candidatus Latescibacterota bacterium]